MIYQSEVIPNAKEHVIQVDIVNAFRKRDILCFSIPNGGWRGNKGIRARVGEKLKFEGLLAGVSDLIVLLPNRCIFIEVKRLKPKKYQEPAQKAFQAQVEALGFEYYLWRTVKEAEDFINSYKAEQDEGNTRDPETNAI